MIGPKKTPLIPGRPHTAFNTISVNVKKLEKPEVTRHNSQFHPRIKEYKVLDKYLLDQYEPI